MQQSRRAAEPMCHHIPLNHLLYAPAQSGSLFRLQKFPISPCMSAQSCPAPGFMPVLSLLHLEAPPGGVQIVCSSLPADIFTECWSLEAGRCRLCCNKRNHELTDWTISAATQICQQQLCWTGWRDFQSKPPFECSLTVCEHILRSLK